MLNNIFFKNGFDIHISIHLSFYLRLGVIALYAPPMVKMPA